MAGLTKKKKKDFVDVEKKQNYKKNLEKKKAGISYACFFVTERNQKGLGYFLPDPPLPPPFPEELPPFPDELPPFPEELPPLPEPEEVGVTSL